MNRNTMYEYLKQVGMYPMVHWKEVNGKKKNYHVEFVENKNKDKRIYAIRTDWGYIRGCTSIHLCAKEIVIESDYGFTKINMYYKDIKNFEVLYEDDDLTGIYRYAKLN